jgi:hypothetical protein
MKNHLLYAALLFNLFIYAQPPIQWQRSIGGLAHDFCRNVLQTSDGGFITVGSSSSNDGDISGNHGSFDISVVKLTNAGIIEWQKSYGGTNSDNAGSIQKTADGGYIIAGTTFSNDGDVAGHHGGFGSDYWIIKITSNGTIEWQKCLGGTNSDSASIALQTHDGGYIVGGNASSIDGNVTGIHNDIGSTGPSDYWIVKLNASGNIVWQKCYGSNSSDYLNSIALTSDGGYILNGEIQQLSGNVTAHYGDFDYWVVKINSTGVIEWQKTLGGSHWDTGVEVIQNSEGNYIVCGFSTSNDRDITAVHGGGDAWVVKLDTIGNIIWQKALGGTGADYLYSIRQTLDGGYVLSGDTTSDDGDASGHHGINTLDCWVIKLSRIGDVEWHKSLGGSGDDTAVSLIEVSNGSYIISGYSTSNDGDITTSYGSTDAWIASLSNNLGVADNRINNLFSFYPNPTKNDINLTIDASIIGTQYTIYDQLSKVVKTGRLDAENLIIQIGSFSNGLYLLNINESQVKIIKN